MKLLTSDAITTTIILLDERRSWSERSANVLQTHGFLARACKSANILILLDELPRQTTLVIMNYLFVGKVQERLIQQILARHCHVLLLCNTLPIAMVRTLFLLGVADIAASPSTPKDLISQIDEVLTKLTPRNSYQAREREGRIWVDKSVSS
jgi:FixJ family two-component response regulator